MDMFVDTWDLKFVDCLPTKNTKIKCPMIKNDSTVLKIYNYIVYHHGQQHLHLIH